MKFATFSGVLFGWFFSLIVKTTHGLTPYLCAGRFAGASPPLMSCWGGWTWRWRCAKLSGLPYAMDVCWVETAVEGVMHILLWASMMVLLLSSPWWLHWHVCIASFLTLPWCRTVMICSLLLSVAILQLIIWSDNDSQIYININVSRCVACNHSVWCKRGEKFIIVYVKTSRSCLNYYLIDI